MRILFTLLLSAAADKAMAQQPASSTIMTIPNATVTIPGVEGQGNAPDIIITKDTTRVIDWDKMKKPFPTADVKPRFNGNLGQYLGSNIKVPKGVKQGGTIKTEFLVDTNGRVGMVVIEGKEHGEKLTPMEKEVVRVIKAMPPWIPGMREGKKVPIKYSLPINMN